jgi:putative ATP-dependent endonuclease of the OLD family
MISRVVIQNYRVFREFDLELAPDINIIVGKNDTGKSTLIEAIALALTRRLHGVRFDQELSPYLINQEATREWVGELVAREPEAAPPAPPELVIELYFHDLDGAEILRGTNNLRNEDACGIRLQAKLASDFYDEYLQFVANPAAAKLAPTEYYSVDLLGFSGTSINTRAIPMGVSLVDPTTISLRAGVD